MARAALDAKAEDLVILDLRKLSFSFDFFVLCSAASDRRVQAIADGIREKLSPSGLRPGHLEGKGQGGWVLLDYGAVVAHLFSPEVRRFYDLERLWGDAPHLRLPNHS
ncbi:MAG: ribosome silencing factor [Candidatus Omnitrophica bacterium]|nr:ribosome silencing factor [Candidatus Omnitrophota bacterium]